MVLIALLLLMPLPSLATIGVPEKGRIAIEAAFPGLFIEYSSDDSAVHTTEGWWDIGSQTSLEDVEPESSALPLTQSRVQSPDGHTIATAHIYSVMLYDVDFDWKIELAHDQLLFYGVEYSSDSQFLAASSVEDKGTRREKHETIVWNLNSFPPRNPLLSTVYLEDRFGQPLQDELLYVAHEETLNPDDSLDPGYYPIQVTTDSTGRASLPIYKTGNHQFRIHYTWPGYESSLWILPPTIWTQIPLEKGSEFLLRLFVVGGAIESTEESAQRPWELVPLSDFSTSVQSRSWGNAKSPGLRNRD